MVQATTAQIHAHGVVHADLKPENVLLAAPLGARFVYNEDWCPMQQSKRFMMYRIVLKQQAPLSQMILKSKPLAASVHSPARH